MSDFMTAWARAMSSRATMPLLVPCSHVTGPFRGVPCAGHPDCRAAYWKHIDDEAAAKVERERVQLGALHAKRRIKV